MEDPPSLSLEERKSVHELSEVSKVQDEDTMSHKEEKQSVVYQSGRSHEYWRNFNKYFFSLFLLSVATGVPLTRDTIDFSIFGFMIFLLFGYHSLAYFGMRVQNEPVYELLSNFKNKPIQTSRDIRGQFSIVFVFIGTLSFMMISIAHIVKMFEQAASITGLSIELIKNDNPFLILMNVLVPNWDKGMGPLFTSLTIFACSLIYVKTLRLERLSQIAKNNANTPLINNLEDFIQSGEGVQKAVQLLKDFKFKRNLIIYSESILLAMIASSGSNILLVVVPYSLFFTLQCLIIGISGKQSSLSWISSCLNIPLMALLLVDLPSKYLLQTTFLQVKSSKTYLAQIVGLTINPDQLISKIEFLLKVLLFIVQCQKLQYPFKTSHDCQMVFNQLKETVNGNTDMKRYFNSRLSLTYRIVKPVSIFFFSAFSVLFALSHPSILQYCFVPLFIFGFFIKNQLNSACETPSGYKFLSKLYLIVITLQIISSQLFTIIARVYLAYKSATFKQNDQDFINIAERILGLNYRTNNENSVIGDVVNRITIDFGYLIALAFFGNFINRKKNLKSLGQGSQHLDIDIQSESKLGRMTVTTLLNNQGEEDVLTLHEESDTPQKILRFKMRNSYTQQPDHPEQFSPIVDKTSKSRNQANFDVKLTPTYQSITRDETLRGHIRRVAFKLYKKCIIIFENFIDLAIIHCSKVSLFVLFFVSSTNGATIFNAILFVLFLVLSTISYQNVQRFWKITIFVDAAIIMSIYTLEVFKIDIKYQNSHTLQLIGLSHSTTSQIIFGKYTAYLILLIVLVFTYHIIHSQRYEQFLQTYQRLEENGENEEINSQDEKKPISDPLTRFIIRYAVYLTVIALFIECVLLPINALNLTLLALMTIIIIKYFASETLVDLYQSLEIIMTALKWVSTIFIFLKYMFQFEDYVATAAFNGLINSDGSSTSAEELKFYYEKLPLFERLLGMENSFIPVKLFSLALVLALTTLQAKFLRYSYLTEMLKKEDTFNTLGKDKLTSRFKLVLHHIKTYGTFLCIQLLKPAPAFLMINYSLKTPSILGLIMVSASLLVTSKSLTNADNLWSKSHKTLGMLAATSLFIIYAAQFIMNCLLADAYPYHFALVRWTLGIQDQQNSWYIDKPLVPLFGIVAICALQKRFSKIQDNFKVTLVQEDMLDPQSDENYEDLQKIWTYESPFRTCLQFKAICIDNFFNKYGLLILQFMMMILMFWKVNITSLIIGVFLIKLTLNKNLEIDTVLKKFSITVGAILLIEYIMMVDIVKVKGLDLLNQEWITIVKLFLCDDSECQAEWTKWLSLGQMSKSFILMDFSLLLIIILVIQKQRTAQNSNQEDDQILPNDEKDFMTNIPSSQSFMTIWLNFVFCFTPYILVTYLLIYGFSGHINGDDLPDMLSGLYMFIGLYYFTHFRKLYTQNSIVLKVLRVYNMVVLMSLIIFQAPLFQCPAVQYTGKYHSTSSIYINNEHCIKIQSQSDQTFDEFRLATSGQGFLAFYIMLINSLGFIKLDWTQGDLQLSLLFLIILTEVQHYIFQHPYFQIYVLSHLQGERHTDGKLRAFIFVEQTHLKTLWSYKAIKEEISILHSRLLRITQAIKLSEHSKHLLLDDDDSEAAQYEEHTSLVSDQSSISEDYDMNMSSDEFDPQARAQIDLQFNKILSNHANDIENIALDLLSRPGAPVVPLKLFMAAFKNFLRNKYRSSSHILESEQDEMIKPFQVDQKTIQEYLLQIASKLQKQVEMKCRIDLYNKDSIGLSFAVEKGSDQLLKDSEYNFYHHLILSTLPTEIYLQSLQPSSDENMLLTIDTYTSANRPTFWLSLDSFKLYLWSSFINPLLFYSLSTDSNIQRPTLSNVPLSTLLWSSLLSQSAHLCYFSLFLNFILNADLLSLFLPLSALLYALLNTPLPNVKYWKVLTIYILSVILVKFVYQMPIFCGTPVYSMMGSDGCNAGSSILSPEALMNRIDYVIGIHKYRGYASYPSEQGIMIGIIPDILVLGCLLLVKTYLIKMGIWHSIRIKNSIYDTPCFKSDEYQSFIVIPSTFKGKMLHFSQILWKNMTFFVLRLLPIYMNNQQRNRDLRTQDAEPYINHNVKRVKPGKDYFSSSFFSLLLIFIVNLFFFRNYTGESHSSALSTANLQRFSIPQVAILFFILLLMMIERMLYRVRQIDSQSAFANQSVLGKHQLTFKFIIHVLLVLFVHIELGFIVPKYNSITFDKKTPLVLSYLLWVYYFVSSALQIRHGYPQAPFKAPFIRDTSYLTVWAFRIYKAMPFLWEMKVIIDWTVTTTCLDLYQWFKLDDAFNYLYQCQIQNNDRAEKTEYAQRSWCEKFFQGFCFAFGLILVILAPILLFSGINPIMVNNPIFSGQLQVSIELNQNGNTYNILQTQAFHIEKLNKTDLESLKSMFAEGGTQFDQQNMQKMYFSPYSEVGWQISPPSLQKFIEDYDQIKDDKYAFFDIQAKWSFKRDNPIGNEVATQETKSRIQIRKLQPIIDTLSRKTIQEGSESTILVENLFPKVLKLGDTQQSHLMDIIPIMSNISTLGSARLVLNQGDQQKEQNNTESSSGSQLYWTYEILKSDQLGIFNGRDTPAQKVDSPNMVLVVYNDQVIGSLFGTALQLSVVGLYATIVIAIGRFLRLAFDRISQRVIYEEMDPETTEQLFEICEGIYIAQLEGDLVKEKRLYDLLIRMYRSPETLIRVNRAQNRQKEDSNTKLFMSLGNSMSKKNHYLPSENMK